MAGAEVNSSVGRGQKFDFELTENGYKMVKACQDRFVPPAGAKDITFQIDKYRPFDQYHSETFAALNAFGAVLDKDAHTINSSTVYQSIDGKRLVVEVGCNTVIYIQISPGNTATHHRFFIQSHQQFLEDINTKLLAAEIVKSTGPMVTLVKYEMYFLLGMFSTVSVPMWLAVTGSDVTVLLVDNKVKMDAFKKLANDLLAELENIKQYAPTLHKKLLEFMDSEKQGNWSRFGKQLPKTIISDEKVQGQVAGILYGKYALSAKAFNAWLAVSTVLVQGAVKSVTKSVDAYNTVINDRYSPIVKSLANADWNNPVEVQKASSQLVTIMKEAGVQITQQEAAQILIEVNNHPKELQRSLLNIQKSFTEFQRTVR
ncbi:MAG: hypothetical protein AMJ53_06135 [Gammaproteobacteria bacterium SG8_11]|nr:MAG: hypothetical protein AMJ53_06135 [Gammaproteobacteria bacterium SG8_11]